MILPTVGDSLPKLGRELAIPVCFVRSLSLQ